MPLGVPLIKFAALAFKLLTKPIESVFKARIKNSTRFREKAIKYGGLYNYHTLKLQ